MKWLLRYPVHFLGWHLFGLPSVVLIDFDGETTVAFVRDHILGGSYAVRMSLGVSKVRLLPDGKIANRTYVTHWMDAPWNKNAVKISE